MSAADWMDDMLGDGAVVPTHKGLEEAKKNEAHDAEVRERIASSPSPLMRKPTEKVGLFKVEVVNRDETDTLVTAMSSAKLDGLAIHSVNLRVPAGFHAQLVQRTKGSVHSAILGLLEYALDELTRTGKRLMIEQKTPEAWMARDEHGAKKAKNPAAPPASE